MKKETEMKIYKALGVEYFRKGAFMLEKLIHKNDNKKNRNYHVENTTNSEGVDKFKKFFYYNGNIHLRNLVRGSLVLTGLIVFNVTPLVIVPLSIWLLKDTYCVMLQRYNWLRVSIYEDKLKEREKRKVDKVKDNCYNDETIRKIKEKEELLKSIKALRECLVNSYTDVNLVNESINEVDILLNSEDNVTLTRRLK